MRTVVDPTLPDSLLAEVEAAITAMVREAGQIALRHLQSPLQVEFKQENRSDPVTEADRAVEAFLKSSILDRFPEHGVLGEEGTNVDVELRDFVWALDPIDGTTNYMNRLPLFGCSAGLLYRGTPVVGAIFVPVAPLLSTADQRDSTWGPHSAVLHARLGGGTRLDDLPVRAATAVKPEATMLVGLPGFHSSQFRRNGGLRFNPGEPRCLGSVSYETAMVTCGLFGYSVFRRPKIWDVAAGVLLVREAGGTALQWAEGQWMPMTRFERMKAPKDDPEPSLRYWSRTLLLGGCEATQYVASRLRPGRGFAYRIADRLTGFLETWRRKDQSGGKHGK